MRSLTKAGQKKQSAPLVFEADTNPSETRVLALDQSSRKTGFAVFDGTDLVKYGVIDVDRCNDKELRVRSMCEQVMGIVKRFKPNVVILEGITVQGSVAVALLLSQVQGRMIQIAEEHGCRIKIALPSEWRRVLGFRQGKDVQREQLKEQATSFIEKSYHISPGEDCCEAICIGLSHCYQVGLLPKKEIDHNED